MAVPDINNAGKVALYTTMDGAGEGIFTGPDPVNDKVIRTGDSLFGSTVTNVGLLHGLNEAGDVAFFYALANGNNGIAVANVPEPSAGALVGMTLTLAGATPRRRRRHLP